MWYCVKRIIDGYQTYLGMDLDKAVRKMGRGSCYGKGPTRYQAEQDCEKRRGPILEQLRNRRVGI